MKNKLIILQGPPASGKSTWAKEFVSKNKDHIIVNRDSLRLMFRGQYPKDESKLEEVVSSMEIYSIKEAIKNGYNVIIDATNLNPKTLNKWKTLVNELSVEIEYKQFYISFFEALERDKKRGEKSGNT